MIKRGYINIGSSGSHRLMHYRMTGKGSPVLLLHASPTSSVTMMPLMDILSDTCTLIAPDTPGYGYSTPLHEETPVMEDYVQALDRFCMKLGLKNMGLYGSATGAQIGIEYAKRFPDKVNFLILDNAADFTDAERVKITTGYFPDLTPDEFGSHLAKIWTIARDLGVFFPWHLRVEDKRISNPMVVADLVHKTAMEYMQAGPGYAKAYHVAFANEKAEKILSVSCPTTIIRWASSIIKPYSDRLDMFNWPEHITMLFCGPTREDRLNAIFESVKSQSADVSDDTDINNASGSKDVLSPCFISLENTQIHYNETGMRNEKNILILHNLGESSLSVKDLCVSLGRQNHVVAPDLPGHGASETLVDNAKDMVNRLVLLLKELDFLADYILAFGDSAAIAMELAGQIENEALQLGLLNPISYPDCATKIDVRKLVPELSITDHGSHLNQIWYMLKDQTSFWPWYEQDPEHAITGQPDLDPEYMTGRLLDYLRAHQTLERVIQEVTDYPLREKINNAAFTIGLGVLNDSPLSSVTRKCFSGSHLSELEKNSAELQNWFEGMIPDYANKQPLH